MPNQEVYGSPLGGHTDLLFSHPVYWGNRAAGQPLVENDPKYGNVYHIGSADDFIEMAKREDVLISMPHPRTKGSTGYPDAVKDQAFFKDPHYEGVGFRWGMGLDLSEQRLCDRRCLTLLDDMSNWSADWPGPPKYLIAITETRFKAPGDEVYAASPVNYVKLDRVPSSDDVSPVVKALMRGDSFVTSGEVLVPSYSLTQGQGSQRDVRPRRSSGPSRSSSSRSSGATARPPIERSSPPPICRRSAASISRSRSMRPERSGSASPPGTQRATGRFFSPSNWQVGRVRQVGQVGLVGERLRPS